MSVELRNSIRNRKQAGFTLIEALIAMVILSVGIMAIANLFVVSATSNAVADAGTSSAAVASQVMERLKARPIGALVVGGSANADFGPTLDCLAGDLSTTWNCDSEAVFANATGGGADSYTIHVQWQIAAAAAAPGPGTIFILVGAQPRAGVLIASRARAEFTTWRTSMPPLLPPPAP